MSYPFSEDILKLLQIKTSPDVYLKARERGWYFGFNHPEEPRWLDYIQHIPTYKYAECPFCGTEYSDPIDTYFVRPILRYDLGHLSIYYAGYFKNTPCSHLVGTHGYMNYHGIWPEEVEELREYAEVPYVARQIINGVDEAYLVLHALPVCRIEQGEFVPRYTLFLTTYFARDIRPIFDKHYAQEYGPNQGDPEFFPYNLVWYNVNFDLAEYAEQGILGWLDYTNPTLPLVIGQGMKLPDIYQDIEGKRGMYHWKRNSLAQRFRRLKRAILGSISNLNPG